MQTPLALTLPALALALGLFGCLSRGAPETGEPETSALATPVTQAARPELSALGREAFERLLHARRFTDDAIYYGGVTPNEVIALRILWREPQARKAFVALLESATLGGQLYALCGLYYTDRERFEAALEPFRARTDTLSYQTGCTGFHDYPLAELIEIERPGAVRLAPGENVFEWLERHDNPRGTKGGYWLDILGGGIPNVFRANGGFGEVRDEAFGPERD